MRRTIAAMVGGRKLWLEQVKAAKAAGVIGKIPVGIRRPCVRKAPSKTVARARGLLYKELEMRKQQPPAPQPSPPLPIPWTEQTRADRLAILTDKSLDVARAILDLPIDPGDKRLLGIQKDMALSIIATQTKVDETQLRRRESDRAAEFRAALERTREDCVKRLSAGMPSDDCFPRVRRQHRHLLRAGVVLHRLRVAVHFRRIPKFCARIPRAFASFQWPMRPVLLSPSYRDR